MDTSSPWVEIVKQPDGRLRFHRGDDVVRDYGESNTSKKAAFPEIKVCEIISSPER